MERRVFMYDPNVAISTKIPAPGVIQSRTVLRLCYGLGAVILMALIAIILA